MGQSLVAGAGLKVRGLICDMVVRFRTSLVTKRALLAKNAMGYHYIDHKHWLEASITLVYYQATSNYIGTLHVLHMHTYTVSIHAHATPWVMHRLAVRVEVLEAAAGRGSQSSRFLPWSRLCSRCARVKERTPVARGDYSPGRACSPTLALRSPSPSTPKRPSKFMHM